MISYVQLPELRLKAAEIFCGMGYGNKVNNDLLPLIGEVISELESHVAPQAGYRILGEAAVVEGNRIKLKEAVFTSGGIINSQIRGLERLALFAVSLGKEFDDWSRGGIFKEDPLKGFVIDTAGSVLVEKAADYLEDSLRRKLSGQYLGCSNRFSPGYCGWDVAEQHILFSLLPAEFCGISLTDSALMQPLKSVSGIIGIGQELKKREYHCSLCDQKDCYLRRRKCQD